MELYDWEGAVRQWAMRRRGLTTPFIDNLVVFFRLAFDHTAFPDRSWFGVHQQVVSLVVGNIWLASVNLSASDRGAWVLLNQSAGKIAGWNNHPTRSTIGSSTPLIWSHAEDATNITAILSHDAFWQRFAEASRDVFNASRVSGDRDETQLRRGKVRLSDFWKPSSLANQLVLSRPKASPAPVATAPTVGPFASEKEFEAAVIVPLLDGLGWPYQREYTFQLTLGTQSHVGRIDFLVSDQDGPITLIENKLQILNDKDLEFARGQARSYASSLELSTFVVAAPQGMWVYAFERGKPQLKRKFEHDALRQCPQELRELLIASR